MIEEVFVLALAVTSTALAGAYAVRRLGWPRRALRPASGKALEWVGVAVVFFLINVVVGGALILGARAATGRFVSFYLGADHMLIAVSALQAVVFQWWREAARRD